MTQGEGVPNESKCRSNWLWVRRGIILLAIFVFGTSALWFYVLGPQPPFVDTSDAGPGVAEDIAEARGDVKRKPFSAGAWGNLGLVFHVYEYYAAASTCYARAAQLDSQNARWPYLLGVVQMRSDVDASLPLLRRAVQLGGKVSTPRVVFGETLLLLNRTEEAEEQFRWVVKKEPRNARALLGLGRGAFARGDLAAARGFLERSAESAPGVRATHVLLAQVLLRLGHRPRADAERARAATLPEKPAWPDPYRVGSIRELRGEAAAIFRAASLLSQGKNEEVIDLMKATLQRHPQSSAAYRKLGTSYFRQANYPAAETEYAEAIRLNPDRLESQYESGIVLEHLGKHSQAVARFRRTLEIMPQYGEAHYHLGRCLQAMGDDTGALDAYHAAVRCQPDLAVCHQALGAMLALKNEDAEAYEELQQAYALDPSHEPTRQWLEIVRRRKSPHN